MANELSVTCSILDNLINQPIGVTGLFVSQAASPGRSSEIRQVIGITEEALQLGELSGATLGYAVFINLDPVNFVEIRVGTGGTKIVKLKAGEAAMFRFGSGISAPYAIADTGACLIRFKIWEA